MWGWDFTPIGHQCDRSKNKVCIISFGGIPDWKGPRNGSLDTDRSASPTFVHHLPLHPIAQIWLIARQRLGDSRTQDSSILSQKQGQCNVQHVILSYRQQLTYKHKSSNKYNVATVAHSRWR